MAGTVAGPTAHTEFVDHGAVTDLEVGLVVELEELSRAAINASPITFAHDTLLPERWMTTASGRIDRTAGPCST